ncbi:MAG: J domain-containing protein [Clostridia bacterium]|nr:J domain-containing protein [Clostridia bacterium]
MTDPYKILGVTPSSSEDEINSAYRNLVKQYHPDKYVGNPLAELAAEKIKEINAAYDEIMNNKKNSSGATRSSEYNYSNNNADNEYQKVRMLINSGRIMEAENILNSIQVRGAEWHFLMGMVMKKKGWYDMAYQHFERATSQDPANMEYRMARDNMGYSGMQYRNVGNMGGYNGSCCDGCQTLICADCCCEMCGGNLIPCIGCR